MAVLKKLMISGFKSFEKTIELPLFNGFNCIIGPNGSGKSNIMDAITFVLGRRTSALRSDKLQNLIFNGSSGKNQITTASVSLVIDNKDRIIQNIDEDEVTITRKVTRSGASSYRINNRTDSKQQIEKVLDAINVISDGHNIIKQGDITKIINMKPKERREIIDEIAGIREYVKKKAKTIDELAYAEKKLSESRLILKEKRENLKRLEKDKNAAEKHKILQDKEEMLLANIAFSRVKAIEGTLENINNNLKIKEQESSSSSGKIVDYDKTLERNEKELDELEDRFFDRTNGTKKDNELLKVEKDIIERSSKIESYRREIERLKEMIESLNDIKDTSARNTRNHAVKTILESDIQGIEGTISSLMSTDSGYSIAIETAARSHLNDIVVKSEQTAIKGINLLKQTNSGRVRFLPLDRLELHRRSNKSEIASKMPGMIDYAINLIDYDPIYDKAFRQVLKDTLIANNHESARKIRGVRIVTLDGDIFEPDGSIQGGSVKKHRQTETIHDFSKIKQYEDDKERLEQSIDDLEDEITNLEKTRTEKERGKEKETKGREDMRQKKLEMKSAIEELKHSRRSDVEETILLEKDIQNLKIRKARLEAEYDNFLIPYEKYKDRTDLKKGDPEILEKQLRTVERDIRNIGPVNLKAIDEYAEFKKGYDSFEEKIRQLEDDKKTIINMIEDIEKKRKELFTDTFKNIVEEFSKVYRKLTEGEGALELENPNDIESGLIIKAQPKDKKLLVIDALSGGEKSMTSIAFLFAVMNYRPSPFYILDEIDAALDNENSRKIGELVSEYSEKSQFLIISHNNTLVQKASRVYGISMKKGRSTIIGLEL